MHFGSRLKGLSCRAEGQMVSAQKMRLVSHFLSTSLFLTASVFIIVLFVFILNPSHSCPSHLLSGSASLSFGLSFSFCRSCRSISCSQNEAIVLKWSAVKTASHSILPSCASSSSSHLLLSLSFCVFSLLQPLFLCVWGGLWWVVWV